MPEEKDKIDEFLDSMEELFAKFLDTAKKNGKKLVLSAHVSGANKDEMAHISMSTADLNYGESARIGAWISHKLLSKFDEKDV